MWGVTDLIVDLQADRRHCDVLGDSLAAGRLVRPLAIGKFGVAQLLERVLLDKNVETRERLNIVGSLEKGPFDTNEAGGGHFFNMVKASTGSS